GEGSFRFTRGARNRWGGGGLCSLSPKGSGTTFVSRFRGKTGVGRKWNATNPPPGPPSPGHLVTPSFDRVALDGDGHRRGLQVGADLQLALEVAGLGEQALERDCLHHGGRGGGGGAERDPVADALDALDE